MKKTSQPASKPPKPFCIDDIDGGDHLGEFNESGEYAASVITVPGTTRRKNAGLVFRRKQAYAYYSADGVRKWKPLPQGLTEIGCRRARDKFYATLIAKGATVAVMGAKGADDSIRRARAEADPMKYIRHEPKVTRSPWSVRIDGTVIGRFTTEEKARAARNRHLGIRKKREKKGQTP